MITVRIVLVFVEAIVVMVVIVQEKSHVFKGKKKLVGN